MDWSRRQTLRVASAPLAGALVAGCLSIDDSEGGNGENGTDDGPARNGDGSDGDADDASIDGRLHNDAATAHTFAVTIRDGTGAVVADGEWDVDANGTTRVPAVAGPGESRTIEVTVNGTTESETLAFDVESTPGTRAGYVDVTYTADGTIDIAFTPIGDGEGDLPLPRVDDPPSPITDPGCGPDGGRDPLWLCEHVPAEPSLSFEQESTTGAILRDEGLGGYHDSDGDQFYATLLTDADDRERVRREDGSTIDDLLEGTDFDSEAVLVVQTGWGSGTIRPHIERIEGVDGGIHAFGCYRRPCEGTDDITARTVVARFERPDPLESGYATLTVDPDRRVTVAAGEGVVTVPDG